MDERFVSQRFPRCPVITPSGSWQRRWRRQFLVVVRVIDRGAGSAAWHARVGLGLWPRGIVNFPWARVRCAGLGHGLVEQRL